MNRFLKITVLTFCFLMIGLISFRCKDYKIRILGIDLVVYNNNFKHVETYTKSTGLMFEIITLHEDIAYLYHSSSQCLAFYDPGVAIINPIDTNTMELYCNSTIIINKDTLLPKTNLLRYNRIAKNIYTYNADKFGGCMFQLLNNDNFFDELNFLYNPDSSFVFTFKALTNDKIALSDSVRIKINWN